MDSYGGVNPVVIFCHFDGGIETVWTGAAAAYRQDGLHTCVLGALEHCGAVGVEIFGFQVRV